MTGPLSFQRQRARVVDPAPDLPDYVLIETPSSITRVNPDQLKRLSADFSEDAMLFATQDYVPRHLGWITADPTGLRPFLDKVLDAIRVQAKAPGMLEALLKVELQADLDNDIEVFDTSLYSHEMLLDRATFRHKTAYATYNTVRGGSLYRKGYLFYNVASVRPAAIVLGKIKFDSPNLV